MELAAKSAIFSESHPEIKRLKAQIEALEKVPVPLTQTPAIAGGNAAAGVLLDPLLLQRMGVQQNLEATSQKLAAAQRGENLERDQFAERLEVLEQAIPPQKPIKPNRPKLIALAFIASIMAAFGGIFFIESVDKTIRSSHDLVAVANGQLVVTIPYLITKAELQNSKSRNLLMLGLAAAVLLVGLLVIHFTLRPLDEAWLILLRRLNF